MQACLESGASVGNSPHSPTTPHDPDPDPPPGHRTDHGPSGEVVRLGTPADGTAGAVVRKG